MKLVYRNPSVHTLIFFAALQFLFPFWCRCQDSPLERWTDNSAIVMPAHKWESGIFQPFRYGINSRIELHSNAIILPVLPNVGIKFRLRSSDGFTISSDHTLSCPAVFMNVVSTKGIGGLISPQYTIPFMMAVSNSLIATKLFQLSTLTADIGITFAIRDYKPDYHASIDIPNIYQRMAHYYEGSSVRAGLAYRGKLSNKIFFEEGFRTFMITRSSDNIFIENRGSLLWSSNMSLRLKGGYTLSWGRYPYGNYWQLWPSFDIIFGSKRKDKSNH